MIRISVLILFVVHAKASCEDGITEEICHSVGESFKNCVWCASDVFTSKCVTSENALTLPTDSFRCKTREPTNHRCHFYNTKEFCVGNHEGSESCYWCQSAAVPSTCYNETEAKSLPSGVFRCDKEDSKPTPENHRCHFYNSKESCISNREGEEPCYWCKSAAVPSTCYNETEAKRLPSGVFQCDKENNEAPPSNHRCHFYNTKESCIGNHEGSESCYWCQSAAVPSTCHNETEAKRLPSAVFQCDKESTKVAPENHRCHFYNSKDSCVPNREGDKPCYWCKSAAVPSTCYNETEAQRLPPGVFQCDKEINQPTPANHRCHFYNTKESCIGNHEGNESCYWCQSAAVPSTCYNETEAKRLPPAVFQCDKGSRVFEASFELSVQSYEAQIFERWAQRYNKVYESQFEKIVRFKIFVENMQLVERHNSNDDNSYLLELNEFADISWEEFRLLYLTTAPQDCSATTIRKQDKWLYPDARDWRSSGIISPVKSQLKCGSCWTFSTTGCLESHHAKTYGKMTLLSEQNLIDCAGAFDTHGCSGGLPSHAFEYIKYNGGIDTEEAYPYHAKEGQCIFVRSGIGATVKAVVNVTYQDEEELTNVVGNIGPVSIAYQVASDFRLYKSGVYDSTVCKNGKQDVNHAVLAVGYNVSSNGKKYWIVKNSWGSRWGMDGYFHIAKGKNMCGLADCASYPIV